MVTDRMLISFGIFLLWIPGTLSGLLPPLLSWLIPILLIYWLISPSLKRTTTNLENKVAKPKEEEAKKEERVWITLASSDPKGAPAQIRVRKQGSIEARNRMFSWLRQHNMHANLEAIDSLSLAQAEQMSIDILVDYVITDWKNLIESGEPVPYSKENCRRLLRQYPGFRENIRVQTSSYEVFRYP